MLIHNMKKVFSVVMLSSMVTVAFADDAAPVYDADNMPSQFDGQPPSGAYPSAAPPPQALFQQQLPPQQSDQSYPPTNVSMSVDQRVGRVEQELNSLQHSSGLAKSDELQAEVQTLRGQVETLTHQLQQLQAQTKTMYSDLDKRLSKQQLAVKASPTTKTPIQDASPKLDDNDSPASPAIAAQGKSSMKAASKLEDGVPAAPAPKKPEAVTAEQPNVVEEQQTYQTAYDLIKAKKYNEAIAALQKMLLKYPSGQFAANAHYWLGELYSLTGKNDQAAAEFSVVVKDFTDSPKVADAQLKMGLLYSSDSKWPDAKSAFKKVVNKYPGTAPARLASEQLKLIKQSGH
jgi:tol-pal system protein YbgF